jgi:RimJ/RimL family protein N-acetyltransferase
MNVNIDIPSVTTKRLLMRAPEMRDFESFASFRASDRVRMQGGPNSRDEAFDMFCSFIGMWHLRGYGPWLVADKETDAPLGVVGLYYPDDWPEPEITWGVFEPAEGRGVAYEAALETRRYASVVLGLPPLVSLTVPQNNRSITLAKRLGAHYEGDYIHPTAGKKLNIWRHQLHDPLADG